jgi:hypothetical protein
MQDGSSYLRRVQGWINLAWDALTGFLRRRRKWAQLIIGGLYAFVLTTLALGAWRERALIIQWLGRLTPQVLAGVFIIYSFNLMLAVIVWHLIMAQLSGIKSFRLHFVVYCVTNLARRLPGVLWHVVGRVYLYEQEGISKTMVSMGSMLEAVLVVVSGVIVYFLFLPFHQQNGLVNPMWLLGVIAIGGVLISPPFLTLLYRLMGGIERIPVSYWNLLAWLVIFVIIWSIGGLMVCYFVSSIIPLSFTQMLYIISSWGLAGGLSAIVVFLPSGFGILEISLAVMLSRIISFPLAAFSVLALRLLLMFFELIWSLIALAVTRMCY